MATIEIDYSELKGKIRAVFDTQEAFADAMGMSRNAVSQRLTGAIEWKIKEIAKACDVLGIPIADAHIYFLTVSRRQTLDF